MDGDILHMMEQPKFEKCITLVIIILSAFAEFKCFHFNTTTTTTTTTRTTREASTI